MNENKLREPANYYVYVIRQESVYVSVSRVMAAVLAVNDFSVQTADGPRAALDVLKHADTYRRNANDPDKAEYFVREEWLDTVAESKAINEIGLFGNQNTVYQPLTPK